MSAHDDSTFLRMFVLVLGALVVFTIVILFLANMITDSVDEARGPDPRLQEAVAERIEPIGSVNVAAADPASAAPKSGADIAAAACNACHSAGVLGAPKTGDKAAWQQRLSAVGGVDELTASAIRGKGGMPPKGGANVSDDEVRAAVEHMLSESGVDIGASAPAAAQAPAPAPAPEPAVQPAGPVAAVKQMASDAVDAAQSVAAAVVPGVAAPAAEPAVVGSVDLEKGKSVYTAACFACHGTGALNAPKLGDHAAWAPRAAQGLDALNANAINGKGTMPAKGGRTDLSDADVIAAVAYILYESQ